MLGNDLGGVVSLFVAARTGIYFFSSLILNNNSEKNKKTNYLFDWRLGMGWDGFLLLNE